jgi:hypothetical protein
MRLDGKFVPILFRQSMLTFICQTVQKQGKQDDLLPDKTKTESGVKEE